METRYSANNIVYVERWVLLMDPNRKSFAFNYDKDGKGIWTCEVDLPLIGRKVAGESSDLISLILKIADEAYEIIQEYMLDHKDIKVPQKYVDGYYVLIPDKDGEDFTITLLDTKRKQFGDRNKEFMEEVRYDLSRLITQLIDINRTSKGAYIHVIDKSLLSKSDDEKVLREQMRKYVMKVHGKQGMFSTIFALGDSVIAFGYPFRFTIDELIK